MPKPTICIDFDGVIHSYEHGWKNGEIYGTVTEGFFEWATEMKKHFLLVIYSPLREDLDKRLAMWSWLKHEWGQWRHFKMDQSLANPVLYGDFEFAHEKPSAFMTIDDRCICFDGDWSKITADAIFSFKPWNKS